MEKNKTSCAYYNHWWFPKADILGTNKKEYVCVRCGKKVIK